MNDPPHGSVAFRLAPEHLALALDAGQLGVWEYDLERGTVTWSPGLERIHGLEVGTFEGTFEAYTKDMHPADRDRVLEAIELSIQGARPHELEYRIVRPDGAVRWLNARGRVDRDSKGRPIRMLGICMDVTERKEAELAARTAGAWFETVIHSIGDGVVTTDASGVLSLMNEVAQRLAGVELEQARGRPLTDVLHLIDETTREPIENPVSRVLRENTTVGLANHTLLLRPDGTEIAIDDSAAPIRGDDGEIVGVVMVFSDVTERRQEERRREFAAEATAVLAQSLDYKTTLETVARLAVPRIADWCAVDVLGTDGTLERVGVAHVDPKKVALARELHRRYPPDLSAPQGVGNVLRTGRPELYAEIPDELLVATTRDAEHLELMRALGLRSAMVVPIQHRGETLGAITFVTAEHAHRLGPIDLQLAEELASSAAIAIQNARLYAEAQHNLRAREDLLAMVSHDLRNPLQVMAMRTAVLKRSVTADRVSDLEAIERASAHMERLIRDLLDYARIDAGQFSLDSAPHEAEDILVEALEAVSPLATRASIRMLREGTAKGVQLLCDRQRILQLLGNLLANAVRFTPEGGTITLGVRHRDAELHLHVTDTGPGVPQADRERLFQRYFRANREHREGLGLGLFIANGIAEAHGGRIWVEGNEGEGATFRVALPLDGPSAVARPERGSS